MADALPALTIRAAAPGDEAALSSLLGELGYPSPAARVGARLARLDRAGGTHAPDQVFVACAADERDVLGMLALHRFAGLHDDAYVALITALVVAERARGLRVGRRLVGRAAEAARAWGCARLMVTTHVRRADAHAFYERLGFELTGRRYVLAL